jgi:hypothetical protein
MNALEFDVSLGLPRHDKKSHDSDKNSVQNNSDADWKGNNSIEVVSLSTEIDSSVLISPHYYSGSHSKHARCKSKHSMHDLIPLPPVLEVSIGDDLQSCNQSPA